MKPWQQQAEWNDADGKFLKDAFKRFGISEKFHRFFHPGYSGNSGLSCDDRLRDTHHDWRDGNRILLIKFKMKMSWGVFTAPAF